MVSKREEAMGALFAALAGVGGAAVVRNEFDPNIPKKGQVIVSDGEIPEPEQTLSPVSYYYSHYAHVLVMVEAGKSTARDSLMDKILKDIDTALLADSTLGGVVDYMHVESIEFEHEAIDGGQDSKGALVRVLMNYETSSPLG